MFRRLTIRQRLGLAYAATLVAALTVFAIVAVAVVDREQHVALDARLQSTADALRIVGDDVGGRLGADAGDRRQFAAIAGSRISAAILQRDGSLLMANDENVTAVRSLFPNPSLGSHLARPQNGLPLQIVVAPIAPKGRLIGYAAVWSGTEAIRALDRNVAVSFAILIPFIAALAALAGAEISRRGLLPLNRIASLASEIEANDLSRRLAVPESRDEVGVLSATFDRMLDRLQRAFERERQFTSDASHELRAPLSVIRAEADLALRAERSPAEYRTALEAIAAEADALETLTRELLAAARGMDEFADIRGPVDLSSVVSTVAQRMNPIVGTRRLSVEGATNGTAVVDGNRALLERAVLIVLDNAFKYSGEEASVAIRVSQRDSRAELTVRDSGPGFTEAALVHAFDRFWRDGGPASADGSGLGLTLAKTIVERYGGTIALVNGESCGAVVQMSFPALADAAYSEIEKPGRAAFATNGRG